MDRQALKKSILLVEDDPSVAFVVSEFLTMFFSAGVLTASSSKEAKVLWNENPSIAAVLTDVNLPDDGGINLATALAADRQDVEFVLMSGGLLSPDFLSKEIGRPVKVLAKPFTPNGIKKAFSGVLEAKQCADERQMIV